MTRVIETRVKIEFFNFFFFEDRVRWNGIATVQILILFRQQILESIAHFLNLQITILVVYVILIIDSSRLIKQNVSPFESPIVVLIMSSVIMSQRQIRVPR